MTAPGCLAVVTSRDQLTSLVAREGAYPITLDPLSPGQAVEVLARHLGPDRVASAPEDAAGVVRVCAGLPLALALVAARAAGHPGVPLAELAAEVRARRPRRVRRR